MKSFKFEILVLTLTFFLGCVGLPQSGQVSQHGVEVGNPDPNGKKITVIPPDREQIYVLQSFSAPTVRIVEILDGIYQSQFTEFAEFENDRLLSVTFGADDFIEFFLDFNDLYQLIEVLFISGGVSQSVPFIEETPESPCLIIGNNAANALAESLCSRIVACNETYSCDSCVAEVLEAPGLGQRFGGRNTLKENAQGIQDGEITVDPANLETCLMDIDIIPCPIVTEHLNDSTPPNYNSVKEMIPSPSCDKGVLK